MINAIMDLVLRDKVLKEQSQYLSIEIDKELPVDFQCCLHLHYPPVGKLSIWRKSNNPENPMTVQIGKCWFIEDAGMYTSEIEMIKASLEIILGSEYNSELEGK